MRRPAKVEIISIDRLLADERLLWDMMTHVEARMNSKQHEIYLTLQQIASHREWAAFHRGKLELDKIHLNLRRNRTTV